MNFELNEQQLVFSDTLSRFAVDRYDALLRESYLEKHEGYEPKVWQELASLGLISLRQDEADGGLGGDMADLYVAIRSLGPALLLDPWLPTLIASRLLTSLGDSQQRSQWLADLAIGGSTMGVALTEAGPAHPLFQRATETTSTNDGFLINGHKKAALAAMADHYIVSATDSNEGSVRLFIVPTNTDGLSRRVYRAVDGSLVCDLDLSNCAVPAAALLGSAEDTSMALEDALAEAFIALSAEALGIMDKAMSDTIEHLKLRQQFGVPLASFQALQHRMADCATELELVRGLTMKAALMADDKQTARKDILLAAFGLKAMTSKVARLVAEETVQMHGAMGITEELWVGQAMKRLLMISLLFGDERSQTLYADTLRKGEH